jgi:DNA-binding MarR family transcriptional regulator
MKHNKDVSEEIKIGYLIVSISRMLTSRADRSMEQIGLFRGQAILLMILSDNDGLTHSEIAQKLEISPAAATKVIKRMEVLNYLQRHADPADDRISRVYLKEDAWAVIQRIKDVFKQSDEIIQAGLSSNELATLTDLLQRVRANLQKSLTDPIETD